MKTRFIVNTRSGRATRALPGVQAFAETHGADIVFTERPRHAAELTQRALDEDHELIVAVGGDGTMNEVASALTGTRAILGLVPCGSGDGLGRHLGIHGSLSHTLAVLTHGRPHTIDCGLANDHVFFTAAGLGFEAEIARRFNRLQRRGFFRYLTTSAVAWRQWEPQTATIAHAGGTATTRLFTLAVANADQYGNGARIAPAAHVDDGLLNLTSIPAVTGWNMLPLAFRLFLGRIDRHSDVLALVGTRFRVELERPGWLHTDGELHETGSSVEFEVRPACLKIMVPAA